MSETPQEIVDRVFRENRRYTGDGLPGEPQNAPLPVGDPASGPHNPKKADMREALKAPIAAAAQSASEAAASAGEAEADANRAEAAAQSVVARAWFKTVANLLADNNTVIGYAGSGAQFEVQAGDIIEAQGFRYEVAASDAPDAHVETAGGVKLIVLPAANGSYRFEAFGAVLDGTTNDDTAITTALTLDGMFILNDVARVTSIPTITADQSIVGLGRFVTTDSARKGDELGASITFYVDASAGNDANPGSSAQPFKTLNRALRQLDFNAPFGVQQTILLRDGTHTESDVPASDMFRPAIGYITQAPSGDRTDQTGGSLFGPVVIRGEGRDTTILEIGGGGLLYGIYCTNGRTIAFHDLTIQTDGVTACQGLALAHRQGYVHARNVKLDGRGVASYGAGSEAGGVFELIGDSIVRGCTTNILSFEESLVVVSNDTIVDTPGNSNIGGRGTVKLYNRVQVTGNIRAEGTKLDIRGVGPSDRVLIDGDMDFWNVEVAATWVDFTNTIDAYFSRLDLNACGFSHSIFMRGGQINLRSGTTTFVSPATQSTVVNPIFLLNDAIFTTDNNYTYLGSGGKTGPTRAVSTYTVSGNGLTIPYYRNAGHHATQRIEAASTNRTGTLLAIVTNEGSKTPTEGDLWSIWFAGAGSVEIVQGAGPQRAVIAGGSVTLGLNAGQYVGVTFVWSGAVWVEVSRSAAV